MSQFLTPRQSFRDLDGEAAARLIAAAADVALVLDGKGVIRDLAFGSEELSNEGYAKWLGKHWSDTVTAESQPKVAALLKDAGQRAAPTWRHVNHPSSNGADVPILYSAIQVGKAGNVVALGRNLRAAAALQQRLVEAQQSIERDYARLRLAETRYRFLFHIASEAILIIDASTQKIVEANPAATALLGITAKQAVGRLFPCGFDAAGTRTVEGLLAAVRSAGSGEDVRARLGDKRQLVVSASLFRQESTAQILVRLWPERVDGADNSPVKTRSALLRTLESLPDGVVVTSPDGRILAANRAFLELVQLSSEEQIRGRSLDEWLGRPGVDLNVLIANLRQHESLRLFATTVRGDYGVVTQVEISAVSVPEGDPPCLGFTIRNVGRRLPSGSGGAARELPRSIEQLTELIGRVPLKDIVRETTDVIERLCIEAALQLTSDNRASAAEMLGLSRQSLYVKLHRYGLVDFDALNEG